MACHLSATNPLLDLIMTYGQLNGKEHGVLQ